MKEKKLVQVTYNWFSFEKGDMFSDFTVGEPAYRVDFPRFEFEDQIVDNIEFVSDSTVKVTFENGELFQNNLNSWAYATISGSEAGSSEDSSGDDR